MTVSRTYMLCPIFLMVCYPIGTDIPYEIDGQDNLTRPFAKKKNKSKFIQKIKRQPPRLPYTLCTSLFSCVI